MASRKLIVEIVGDASSLERAFKKSARASGQFESTTKRTSRSITRSVAGLTAGFIGTAGLVTAARAAFGEMLDAQKVMAQTKAVLKSTGKQANVTAKDVETLAGSLSDMSGVDDELIQQSENLLLTFTKIRNETGKGNRIFDRATETILDMSVALGTDMQSAAIQVGKALNDPIRGLTALRRVGVSFTDAQEDQIKALVKSGKTLEAQKIILRELQVEFGGSAKAAGDTLPGKLNKLRNTVLELGATLAGVLTPSIEKLVDRLVKWLQNSKNQKTITDLVTAAAQILAGVLRALAKMFQILNDITGSTTRTLKILFGVLVAFKTAQLIATFAGIAGNIGLIGRNARTSTMQIGRLGGALRLLGAAGLIAGGVMAVQHAAKHKGLLGPPLSRQGTKGLDEFLRKYEGKGKGPNVTNYNAPVNVYGVQNPRQFEEEMAKRSKSRPHQRRGAR